MLETKAISMSSPTPIVFGEYPLVSLSDSIIMICGTVAALILIIMNLLDIKNAIEDNGILNFNCRLNKDSVSADIYCDDVCHLAFVLERVSKLGRVTTWIDGNRIYFAPSE